MDTTNLTGRKQILILLSILSLCLCEFSQSEVSWFGEQRGGKPEDNFYDIIYDDSVCPTTLKGNAVANYVFNGALIKTEWVANSGECLKQCYKEKRCRSVNFYPSRRTEVKNVCELSEQSQIFDPNLMVYFDGATYYENIECQVENKQQTAEKLRPLPADEEHGPLFPDQKETKLREKSPRFFKKQLQLPELQGMHLQ